ncbi:MAG: efflux RND transporter periplasmic adaptor subunit [Limisphaerales bacterium]
MKNYLPIMLGLGAAFLLTGCDRPAKTAAQKEVAPGVQVIHPKKGEITRRITLPGNVRADQETILYAKVAGYLKNIPVDRGDFVKAGDVLAEIEAPEMLSDLAKFKAEVKAAQAEASRLTEAQKKSPDFVTPQAVDAATGKYEMALANLQHVETLLGYSKIIAPFSGVVTKGWVDTGAFIPAATSGSAAKNAAVVTLMGFSKVRVEVAISQPDAPLVKKDLLVKVLVEELHGREFNGKISRFAYALDDSTKTMPTEIEIENTDLALRPGMWASVQIALDKKADALLLPAEALVTEKNKSSVFIVRDNKAVKVAVKIGFDDAINVEILQGVTPDDLVILAGKQAISDGQAVNATEAK